MNAAFFKYLYELRASYWFLPSIMAVGALMLAVETTYLDQSVSTDWPEDIPFMYSNKPDGARSLLSTVAGSMITVAGVTFSLTLLAVSHATSQFGPRLLDNFMRDRGNQITLGTFIATFLYCLMILRTVRTAETGDGPDLAAAFVPHISIAVALLLTLCSVGVLIYFFHHIPESIHLSNVVSAVGYQLTDSIDNLFPEEIGQSADSDEVSEPSPLPENFDQTAVPITVKGVGYVQAMDDDRLLDFATEDDLIIRLRCRPGDFVRRSQTVFQVWPPERVTEETSRRLSSMIAYGVSRTPQQNMLFLVDQLVEMAARALSPGINDPFTAMVCMDWLGNSLCVLAQRKDPQGYRYDDEGQLRIVAPHVTFESVCDATFSQLRPYVATDRNAAIHAMQTIRRVLDQVSAPSRIDVLQKHARELFEGAKVAPLQEVDVQQLRELLESITD